MMACLYIKAYEKCYLRAIGLCFLYVSITLAFRLKFPASISKNMNGPKAHVCTKKTHKTYNSKHYSQLG